MSDSHTAASGGDVFDTVADVKFKPDFDTTCHALRADGFAVMPRALGSNLLDRLLREASHALRCADDMCTSPRNNQWVPLLGVDHPIARALFTSTSLTRLAEAALGRPVFGVMCDANRFMGTHDMHRDALSQNLSGVRFNFYLSENHRDRILLKWRPGSHCFDGMEGGSPGDSPSPKWSACRPQRGDAVVFDLRTLHGLPTLLNELPDSESRLFVSVFLYAIPVSECEVRAVAASARRNVAAPIHFHDGRIPLYPRDLTDWLPDAWVRALTTHGFLAR